jgi:polysaccharide export outer membrane protein
MESERMTRRAVTLLLGCVLVARPSTAQVGDAAPRREAKVTSAPSAAASKPVDTAGDYVIGRDDLLSVVFWREQQLSGDVLVRPDGKISLPLLDDVVAAGLTPQQLRDRLRTGARDFLTDPIVTVVVKQINSRRVYITGQVVRPGQYPLTPSMTVLQLIATAGGLGDYAKPKDIHVVRVEEGRTNKFRFDYTEMSKSSKRSQDIELKSGDTVIVP